MSSDTDSVENPSVRLLTYDMDVDTENGEVAIARG
jgi:hypothetical protein